MPIRIALGEDGLIVRVGVRQLFAVDPEVESRGGGGPALTSPGLRRRAPGRGADTQAEFDAIKAKALA